MNICFLLCFVTKRAFKSSPLDETETFLQCIEYNEK